MPSHPSFVKLPQRLWSRAQDLLEKGVKHDAQNDLVRPPQFWMRAVTWSLIGTSAAGLAWLALAHTEEVVIARGKLEPVGGVKDVQMPLQGVARQILVKDGDTVKAGQVLIRLDTEASGERRANTLKTISLKRRELQLKEQELDKVIDYFRIEQQSLRTSLALSKEILSRYDKLSKQGATAELQYLEQRNKVQDIANDLAKIGVDAKRQNSVLDQQIQALRGQISELNTQLTESSVTLRYQEVRSPVTGIVFENKVRGPGYVAQTSEPVMKIVPFDQLKAKVEIPSRSIGFVAVGKPVDISIDSFPSTDFGVLHGSVTRIGSDAKPPDAAQGQTEYLFPADVSLDSQKLKLKNGKFLPLQVGMSLTANIKLRSVSYLQLLLGSFKDKAESLRQI